MAQGALNFTNNSTKVTGTGTSFINEIKVGDFITTTINNAVFVVIIKEIKSDTELTLTEVFYGPTSAGIVWDAVPMKAATAIPYILGVQTARAARLANLEADNWLQVYTALGDITVTLPDGTQFTGPSWKKLSDAVAAAATKVNGVVPIDQGGTGSKTPFGTANNTFCQGNDPRLNSVSGKTGGEISTAVSVVGNITARKKTVQEPSSGVTIQGSALESTHAIAGNTKVTASLVGQYTWGQSNAFASMFVALYNADGSYLRGSEFTFNGGGSATAPGQWVNNSDQRIKTNIHRIADPLDKMKQLRGVSWDRLDGYAGGLGFIAQDVQKVFPDSVYEGQDRTLTDGTVVKGVLGVDTSGVAAALHHEAILALMEQTEELKAKIK